MIDAHTAPIRRRTILALLGLMTLTTLLFASPPEARAAQGHGTAVCASEMVNIQTPVAGQTHTFVRIHFWNGTSWQQLADGMFSGPVISGAVMVNEANGWYWAPAPAGRYIHVQLWGYYPGSGWSQYSVGHGQLFGPRTYTYCQA